MAAMHRLLCLTAVLFLCVGVVLSKDQIKNPKLTEHTGGQAVGRRLLSTGEYPPHPPSVPKLADAFGNKVGFYHGVASGDPLPDAVIIWTRYTPMHQEEEVNIEFRVAELTPGANKDTILDPIHNGANIRMGHKMALPEHDWTIKLDVKNLKPGTQYVYAFLDPAGVASPVGMTKTSPIGHVAELNYAVFSCSNWGFGYFHAYNVASTIEKLDFWIHLGDYIYEYDVNTYPTTNVREATGGGRLEPEWEVVDLQDYRLRYAQYNTDIALQNLRRRAPLVAIWDDHELANDAFNTGAENHQEVCEGAGCTEHEGIFAARMGNAARAYLEWMPIRNGRFFTDTGVIDGVDITQVVEWGNLATLAGFDTRIKSRTKSSPKGGGIFTPNAVGLFGYTNTDTSSYLNSPELAAAAQSVIAEYSKNTSFQLGNEQRTVMKDIFANSKASGKPWQIWATQTVFGMQPPPNYDMLPSVTPGTETLVNSLYESAGPTLRIIAAAQTAQVPWNTDSWDGYMYERKVISKMLKDATNNAVVLSGDSHDAWAFTLTEEGDGTNGQEIGVNICTASVASPGWLPYLPAIWDYGLGPAGYQATNALWVAATPGLKYADVKDKGFVAVKVTPTEHISEFISITDDLNSATPSMAGIQKQPYSDFPLVAPFKCAKALKTTAGNPGSLESVPCGNVLFGTQRPAYLEATVPSTPGWLQIAWGRPQYASCQMPWTWLQLAQGFQGCNLEPRYKTGGLGALMRYQGYEVWVCVKDHPCASLVGDYFCFVYHEMRNEFTPWGENKELHLVTGI